MIGPAYSPQDCQVHSPDRRSLLSMLATASLALPAVLLTGCAHAIPPRRYKKPAGYIHGNGGNNGKNGN